MKTENTVAMKVTSLSELVNIRNELALQKTCHHSNIVFVGDCFNWRDKLWIVMEFMEKGSLTGILGPDVHFEERFIAYVCQSILRALVQQRSLLLQKQTVVEKRVYGSWSRAISPRTKS